MGTTLKTAKPAGRSDRKRSAVETKLHLPIINQPLPPALPRRRPLQTVDRPPVWLMRQASRFARISHSQTKIHFVQLVQTPELATEVTLQPCVASTSMPLLSSATFSSSPRVWARATNPRRRRHRNGFFSAVRRGHRPIECRSTPRTSQLHRSSLRLTNLPSATKLCSASLAHPGRSPISCSKAGDQRIRQTRRSFIPIASFSINCSKSFQSPSPTSFTFKLTQVLTRSRFLIVSADVLSDADFEAAFRSLDEANRHILQNACPSSFFQRHAWKLANLVDTGAPNPRR